MLKQPKVLLTLVGVATDANGVWFDVSEFEFPMWVLFVGTGAGDAVIVNVTDQYPLPVNTVHDTPVNGTGAVADAPLLIAAPVVGIKARKPAATVSTVVYVLCRGKNP